MKRGASVGSYLLSLSVLLLTILLAMSQSQVSGQVSGPTSLLKEIHDKGELRVGFAAAEPHQFKDLSTGEWKGIAVDLMREWATVLAVKFVPVDTSWDTMIPGLQARKYDFASALNRTPARAVVVTFSAPYFQTDGVIAVNRTKSKARSFADINNPSQTICVVLGTALNKSLELVGAKAKLLRLPDENECRAALQSGKADAYIEEQSSQALYASKNSWVRLIVPNPALLRQGIAFGIRKGYLYDDYQALDIEIEHWVNEGPLVASMKKYNIPDLKPFTER